MPIHSHDSAERLKPERMRQPLQEFVAAVMMDDGLAHNGAERGHAARQPRRNTPAVKRKIRAACPSCHDVRFVVKLPECRTAADIQQSKQAGVSGVASPVIGTTEGTIPGNFGPASE